MQFGGVYYCHVPRLSIESSRKMFVLTLSKKSRLGLQRFTEICRMATGDTHKCVWFHVNELRRQQTAGFVVIPENGLCMIEDTKFETKHNIQIGTKTAKAILSSCWRPTDYHKRRSAIV